jgi:hypothetical protein
MKKCFVQDNFQKIKRIANTVTHPIRIIAIHDLGIREKNDQEAPEGPSVRRMWRVSRLWIIPPSNREVIKYAILQRGILERIGNSRDAEDLVQDMVLASGIRNAVFALNERPARPLAGP